MHRGAPSRSPVSLSLSLSGKPGEDAAAWAKFLDAPAWRATVTCIRLMAKRLSHRSDREDVEAGAMARVLDHLLRGGVVVSGPAYGAVVARSVARDLRLRQLVLLEAPDQIAEQHSSSGFCGVETEFGVAAGRPTGLLRGGRLQRAIMEGVIAGESCESIAERTHRPLKAVRSAARRLADRIFKKCRSDCRPSNSKEE